MTDLAGTSRRHQDLADRTGYDPAFLGPDVPDARAHHRRGRPCCCATCTTRVLFRPDRRFAALDRARPRRRPPVSLGAHRPLAARPPAARRRAGRPAGLRATTTWTAGTWSCGPPRPGGTPRTRPGRPRPRPSTSPTPRPRRRCSTRASELWLGLEDYLQEHAGHLRPQAGRLRRSRARPRRPALPRHPDPAALLEGRRLRPGRRAGRHRLPPRPDAAGPRPRRGARRGRRGRRRPAARGVPHVPGADRRHRRPGRCRTSTSSSWSTG